MNVYLLIFTTTTSHCFDYPYYSFIFIVVNTKDCDSLKIYYVNATLVFSFTTIVVFITPTIVYVLQSTHIIINRYIDFTVDKSMLPLLNPNF